MIPFGQNDAVGPAPKFSMENTLPETNSKSPLKMMVSNRNLFFQGAPIFRGYVSFREGNHHHFHKRDQLINLHYPLKTGVLAGYEQYSNM